MIQDDVVHKTKRLTMFLTPKEVIIILCINGNEEILMDVYS